MRVERVRSPSAQVPHRLSDEMMQNAAGTCGVVTAAGADHSTLDSTGDRLILVVRVQVVRGEWWRTRAQARAFDSEVLRETKQQRSCATAWQGSYEH